jgi:hypothetical protein
VVGLGSGLWVSGRVRVGLGFGLGLALALVLRRPVCFLMELHFFVFFFFMFSFICSICLFLSIYWGTQEIRRGELRRWFRRALVYAAATVKEEGKRGLRTEGVARLQQTERGTLRGVQSIQACG